MWRPWRSGGGNASIWNRHRLHLPKTHSLDAACVGHVDAIHCWQQPVLTIQATGRGSYQYLTRNKSAFGFQTGDLVRAFVTSGKKAGRYLGRVAIRATGSFNIQTATGLVQGITHRFCTLIQRADGYGYSWTKRALNKGDAGMGAAYAAALSLPGMNPGVSRAN